MAEPAALRSHITGPVGFDVDAWLEKISRRPSRATFSAQACYLVRDEDKLRLYDITVFMQYGGVVLPMGAIQLFVDRDLHMELDRFENYFRTDLWMQALHNTYMPHVVTSGVMTSALHWFVCSLISLPRLATMDRVFINLRASSLLQQEDGAEWDAAQAKLVDHYAVMGFVKAPLPGNPWRHDQEEADIVHTPMSSTIAHFLATTSDMATVSFVFTPKTMPPTHTNYDTLQHALNTKEKPAKLV